MYRIDNATAAASLAAATAVGPRPDHYFTNGDAATGVAATVVDAEWLNMIMEEIANLIIGAGGTLDKANRTQMRDAVNTLIQQGSHAVTISNAVFSGNVSDGMVVYWEAANTRFDAALADGSDRNRAVGMADVTNAEVVCFGLTRAGLMADLTPGGRYYLDGVTGGAMTTTAPDNAIKVGIAKSATALFVDIDAARGPHRMDASPVGSVIASGSQTTPDGYLLCNGAALSRTVYADLFAAIGTTFGDGASEDADENEDSEDEATLFNLPDLRGEFLRGWDHGRGVDDGRRFGSSQAGQIEEHNHAVFAQTNATYGPGYPLDIDSHARGNHNTTSPYNSDIELITPYGGVETRPRNVTVNFCIKY